MEATTELFDVRAIRMALFLSQEGMARGLDVSARTVARWERQENQPQLRHLRKLADFVKAERPTLHQGGGKRE